MNLTDWKAHRRGPLAFPEIVPNQDGAGTIDAVGEGVPATRLELREVLERPKARDHRIFAGRLEGERVGLGQRLALALFPGMKGDFRDWDEIGEWAAGIAEKLRG